MYSNINWIEETIAPTSSTPTAVLPSSLPTLIPLSGGDCVDLEIRLKDRIRGKDRLKSCDYIRKNAAKMCKKAAARHFCACSCGERKTCQDTTAIFQLVRKYDRKAINRDCSYATPWRCNTIEEIREACPLTCGKCTT